jgi:predicted ABC-type ATPase
MRMFAGPNGSGKSTLYDELLAKQSFSAVQFINPDLLHKRLNEGGWFPTEAVPDEAAFLEFKHALAESSFPGAGEASGHVVWSRGGIGLRPGTTSASYQSAAIAEVLRERMLASGRAFGFETVMSDVRKLAFMKAAREMKYRIYLYFVSTGDVEINVARVRHRVEHGGHPVPEDKIRSRFTSCLALLPGALSLCSRAFLFDSAGSEHVLVAEYDGSKRELTLTTENVPLWVNDLLSAPTPREVP